ncbi:MAG: hypothetical protein EBR32_06000 [Bacteroidetes bacterium]|nr:hypothetical protein [Bacteroidota bacterium]
MSQQILVGLSAVIALGISAQWFAWRSKLPAILVLLIFGIVAGPVTGWIDPDALLGDLLSPFVSFSVAIILFEGGLSLRMAEFRKIGGVVIKLITVGIAITWVLAALSAYYLLGLSLEIAVLFGAVLIVTGPTVIIPSTSSPNRNSRFCIEVGGYCERSHRGYDGSIGFRDYHLGWLQQYGW